MSGINGHSKVPWALVFVDVGRTATIGLPLSTARRKHQYQPPRNRHQVKGVEAPPEGERSELVVRYVAADGGRETGLDEPAAARSRDQGAAVEEEERPRQERFGVRQGGGRSDQRREGEQPGRDVSDRSQAQQRQVDAERGIRTPITVPRTTKRAPRSTTSARVVARAVAWWVRGSANRAPGGVPLRVSTRMVATATPARLRATKTRRIKVRFAKSPAGGRGPVAG